MPSFLRATQLLRLQQRAGRIVIPRVRATTPSPAGAPPTPHGGASSARVSEYHSNKHVLPHTAQLLDSAGADALARQQQLRTFYDATEASVQQVWRDSKSHLRAQQALVEKMGVDGAVRETLRPSRTGFRESLRQRPLDKAILEEIYLGLHGRRVERRLKKGVSWEHWIAKGEGTSPAYTTSRKGQQTFAFGGRIEEAAVAAHARQFPVLDATGAPRRGAAPVEARLLMPEVAFIGRTSSGKSSLINAIVNASIAPYGHLQGTTDSLHFYSVARRVLLVDCPGYGYYSPMQTPQLDAENALRALRAYLRAGSTRRARGASASSEGEPSDHTPPVETPRYHQPLGAPMATDGAMEQLDEDEAADGSHRRTGRHLRVQPRNLKRVFICVPARGLQDADLEYCRLCERLAVPFAVVITKTDAAPIRMLARLADQIRSQLVQFTHCNELMLTSALRLAGIDKMQSLIGSVAITDSRRADASIDFSAIV